jgi:hypothetical protein
LGIGRFGEFCTFTFEILDNKLLAELRRKKINHGTEHIFAVHHGHCVLGVLRTYAPTNPGKRSQQYQLDLIEPKKDLKIDLDRIASLAYERYAVEPSPPHE